ncbi:MAG: hypothetical protein ACQEQF_01755 [Bacillota bacterium]
MAELDVQNANLDGSELTYTAASAEDTFNNNSNDIELLLKNSDTASHTVTIVAQKDCNHGFLHDEEIEVSADSTFVVRDIERSRFNDDQGQVHITYGGDETNFEVAVVK